MGLSKRIWQCNGENIVSIKTVVHTFNLGDVEDPDIYVAEPIYKWQQSEQGRFVMENSVDKPNYTIHQDFLNFGYKVAIEAELREKDLIFYKLKFQ